jgi:phage repressor protein C with HTH and peptisase S24 domain
LHPSMMKLSIIGNKKDNITVHLTSESMTGSFADKDRLFTRLSRISRYVSYQLCGSLS